MRHCLRDGCRTEAGHLDAFHGHRVPYRSRGRWVRDDDPTVADRSLAHGVDLARSRPTAAAVRG